MNETIKINGTIVKITTEKRTGPEQLINIQALDDKDEMAGMIKVDQVHSRLIQVTVTKPTKRHVS